MAEIQTNEVSSNEVSCFMFLLFTRIKTMPSFRFLQPQYLTLQAGQQMVEIASLNPMQLQQLQEQLKSELELFSNSMQQLRIATSKFQESLQSVAKLG